MTWWGREDKRYMALTNFFKTLPAPERCYWMAAAECMRTRCNLAGLREEVKWESIHGIASRGSGLVVDKERARELLKKKWPKLEASLEKRCRSLEEYYSQKVDEGLLLERSAHERDR